VWGRRQGVGGKAAGGGAGGRRAARCRCWRSAMMPYGIARYAAKTEVSATRRRIPVRQATWQVMLATLKQRHNVPGTIAMNVNGMVMGSA